MCGPDRASWAEIPGENHGGSQVSQKNKAVISWINSPPADAEARTKVILDIVAGVLRREREKKVFPQGEKRREL